MTRRSTLAGFLLAAALLGTTSATAETDRANGFARLLNRYSPDLSPADVEAVFPGPLITYQAVASSSADRVHEFHPAGAPYDVTFFQEIRDGGVVRNALFTSWHNGAEGKMRGACVPIRTVVSKLMTSGWSGPQIQISEGHPEFALAGKGYGQVIIDRGPVTAHLYVEFDEPASGTASEADALRGCLTLFDVRNWPQRTAVQYQAWHPKDIFAGKAP